MTAASDRAYILLLLAASIPVVAVIFALSRATHDLRLVLAADSPAAVAGLCQNGISYTLSPLAHASYVGFGVFAFISGALGVLSLAATFVRTRRRIRHELRLTLPVPASVNDACMKAGIERMTLVDSPEPRAYTYGYLRPAVALTSGLLDCLGPEELEAVLRHEAAHARRRDPLRMLVVASLARAFVFAPVLRTFANDFQIAKEIDADQDVISVMGSRRPLVSALLLVEESREPVAVAPLADVLEARLLSLEGEEQLPRERRRLISLVMSAATVLGIAAGLFVITTGAVDAHVLHVCSG